MTIFAAHSQFMGEFLGSCILILLGNGVVANVSLARSKAQNAGWMVVATGWFVAVVLGVFVAQSTGSPNADINPAVSLTKYFLGHYTNMQLATAVFAQLLGGFLGAILVWLSYLPHWELTKDASAKLACFCTIPAIKKPFANLLSEVIATVVLIIGVGAVFGRATLGHPSTGMGPYLVGVIVWGIGLSLGGQTGYAINPMRDFAPRLAHSLLPISGKGDSQWSYAWVPIVGPLIGCVCATALWRWFVG